MRRINQSKMTLMQSDVMTIHTIHSISRDVENRNLIKLSISEPMFNNEKSMQRDDKLYGVVAHYRDCYTYLLFKYEVKPIFVPDKNTFAG